MGHTSNITQTTVVHEETKGALTTKNKMILLK